MGRASWGITAASTAWPPAAGQGHMKLLLFVVVFFWLVAARRKEVQEHGQKEWAVARNVQPRMDVESQDFL